MPNAKCPLILLLLCTASLAWSDGLVIPPVAVTRMPQMPFQRAVVSYRDGVETLVVESPFKGEGKDLAWILPVPSEPTELKRTTPGIFTALELGLQPEVVVANTLCQILGLGLVVWGLINIVAGRFVPFKALAVAGAIMLALGFWSAMMQPRGTSRAMAMGVDAGEIRRVGNYEIQTLKADSSAALKEWLSTNGYLALPDKALSVVDDYISHNWKFVAARLHREEEGAVARPHPLVISFRTDAPVYPMRLTQLSGSDMRLDLFVIADSQMTAPDMETVYSGRFEASHDNSAKSLIGQSFRSGKALMADFYLPSLAELAGQGDCVVTWLQADLANAQLGTDFHLTHVPTQPTRRKVYTQRSAVEVAATNMLLMAGLVIAVSAMILIRRESVREKLYVGMFSAAACALLAAAAGVGTYWRYPVVDALQMGPDLPVQEIVERLKERPGGLARLTLNEVEAFFKAELKDARNPLTGEPLAFEEAPGDLVIGSDAGGLYVRQFDHHSKIGRPMETRITGKERTPDVLVTTY